jgi:hypothetical protein
LYPPRPPIFPADGASLPDEMKEYPNWVNWKYHLSHGRWTKVPIYRAGHGWPFASSTNPATWVDYYAALSTHLLLEDHDLVGIGFCPSRDTPFTFVDIDKCRDRDTGEIAPEALGYCRLLNTYTEVTVSGTGLRLALVGKKPGDRCLNRQLRVELYDRAHFMAMTGWRLPEFPATIEPRQAELEEFYHRLFPPAAPAPTVPPRVPRASHAPPAPPAFHPATETVGDARAVASLLSPGDLIERARRYLAKVPGAVSGRGGSSWTAHVACILVVSFALSVNDALPLLREWNETCSPPWSDRDLRRKLEWADQRPGPRGRLANAERLQPWEEEIADLLDVPVTVRLGPAPAPPAASAAAAPAGVPAPPAPGDDGARHRAAWEDPRDSDPWAKSLRCPNCRELLMRHRWERHVDVRVVDCHEQTCAACRHNAKRRQALKLRRGIAAGDAVHVCTVPEWSKKVWAALPGTYARVKRTSAGLRVGELVISLGGPPQGLDSQPMTGADALALAESNIAAYDAGGWVVSTSQDWPRDDEPDCASGCWQVIGERPRDLPRLTRQVMRRIAEDNGATLENPPGEVPERLRHRFRAIHRFHYPPDWDEARLGDFVWQLSLGESVPDAGLRGREAGSVPAGFTIDLSAENFCLSG